MDNNRSFKILVEDNSIEETMFLSAFRGFKFTFVQEVTNLGNKYKHIEVDVTLMGGEYNSREWVYFYLSKKDFKHIKNIALNILDACKEKDWIHESINGVISQVLDDYSPIIVDKLVEQLKETKKWIDK